jgi:HlyD family secretion protein
MKAEVVDSPSSSSLPEVSFMEPIRPSSPPARHWRLSIPVSLGLVLLLASLIVAGLSLHSHANHPSTSSTSAATSADDRRWYSLGYVDIEGGVTQVYPLQPGRVKSIEATENESVKAGEALFHLEDTIPAIKLREAEADLQGAQKKMAVAQARVQQIEKQIAAQQQAIAAANVDLDRARVDRDHQKRFQKEGIEGDTATVKNAELVVKKAQAGVQAEQEKLAALEAGKREAEGYVAVAKANIEGKEAQRDEARNAVNECVVRAPVDGVPLRILVNVGQALGSNPRQPAIQFAAQGPLLVRAEVEQEYVSRVRKDQNVLIEDHVTGQPCATGKVVSLARWYAHRRTASPEMLQMNNDVRTLECIIKIESTTQEVRIGQRVRVRFPD